MKSRFLQEKHDEKDMSGLTYRVQRYKMTVSKARNRPRHYLAFLESTNLIFISHQYSLRYTT